jgi:hypothetical protein
VFSSGKKHGGNPQTKVKNRNQNDLQSKDTQRTERNGAGGAKLTFLTAGASVTGLASDFTFHENGAGGFRPGRRGDHFANKRLLHLDLRTVPR